MTNRTEQPSAPRVLTFAVLALIAMCLPGAASAQWTTGGGNTYTTSNVGVGTSTPQNLEGWAKVLDVYGSPHAKFSIRTPSIDARVQVNESGSWGAPPGMIVGMRTNHSISFVTDEISRMTIGNTGNVGIGTTTPSQKLSVLGIGAFYNSIAVQPYGVRGLFMGNFSGGSSIWSYNYVGGAGDPLQVSAQDISLNTYVGGNGVTRLHVNNAGNVGIGTAAPAAKLHVAGDIRVDGNINAKYQDVAEWVPSTQKLAAGTVVVLDPERLNHVLASKSPYDTAVAGVISARPGLTLGEAGGGKTLVATTGRVKVRVDATRGAIKVGDLLVTSGTPGVAMKSQPLDLGGVPIHRPGTLIGKALEPLAGGTGEILVLLSLQ